MILNIKGEKKEGDVSLFEKERIEHQLNSGMDIFSDYEKREIERTSTTLQLIIKLIKSLIKNGNLKVVTISFGRAEAVGVSEFDREHDRVISIGGN